MANGELERFKATQREVWSTGNYVQVGRVLEPVAAALVEAVGVGAGQRVLDVGTGSGNVAVHAARRGADVVGVDHIDTWFDEARRRADQEDLAIELRVADAEDLGVEEGTFDVVLSSFAAIFAPRHDRVAAELVRACRPGGTIALTAWIPGEPPESFAEALGPFLPDGPEVGSPSSLWGERGHVEQLFAPHGVELSFERAELTVSFPSVEAFDDWAFENAGGYIRAKQALEALGRWDEANAAMQAVNQASNEADDGSYRSTWPYLRITATRTG